METLYQTIAKLPHFKPTPKVNRLFRQLVEHALSKEKFPTLGAKKYLLLRKACALGEYELEKHYSKRVASSRFPRSELKRFPYYGNYEDLASLEHSSLLCLGMPLRKILFVGGGPLPLTAIILAVKYGIACDVLEKNEEAAFLSARLIESLSLSSKVSIIAEDASGFAGYNKYSAIFIAALVDPASRKKKAILARVYKGMHTGAFLVIRSAYGNRKLLYAEVKQSALPATPLLEVRPGNRIINSFLVLRK